jgi:hypothetical protein
MRLTSLSRVRILHVLRHWAAGDLLDVTMLPTWDIRVGNTQRELRSCFQARNGSNASSSYRLLSLYLVSHLTVSQQDSLVGHTYPVPAHHNSLPQQESAVFHTSPALEKETQVYSSKYTRPLLG